MRGDLVYEKLGEIDPALVAEALPEAAHMPELYHLGGNNPPPPKKRPNFRKALVVCACLLLAGILLVGGSIALSRTVEFPWETETAETQSNQGNELAYQGIVNIGGYVPLTGSDELEVMGDQLKAIFTAAAPVEDVCECLRDLSVQIGDTTLTYNRDHGCFRDGDTGLVYQLREQDKEYVNDLLTDLESRSVILSFAYEYDTLRHGDDFVFTLAWWEGYGSIYKIDKVYLRYDGEDTEYVTPGFFTVEDQTTYRIRIKDDAPYGKYTLVAHVYSPYTGRNIEMEIPSVPGTVEILPGEPTYTFTESMTHEIYNYGDTIFVNAVMTNNGDPILRWTIDPSILPEVSLRSVSNGKTYPMISEQESDLPGRVIKLNSGESSVGIFYLEFTSSMPVGVYDLVMTFEDHTQVFPNALAVVNPDPSHSIEVTCSFPDGDTLPANGKGSMIVSVTLTGDTMYRYGKANCFCPSVILGTEKGTPIVWMTGPDQNDTDECVRSWENGQTLSFAYVLDFTHTDDEPVKPGVYNLYAYYADEDGNELLDTVLEGVFTVTDP